MHVDCSTIYSTNQATPSKLNMPATFSDYGLPKEEVQAAIPK